LACERYIDLIFSKIDGEISPEDNAELSEHLLKCPECRAEYDALMRLEYTLQNIPKYEVPETFASAVTDKIRVNPKGKKKRGYKPYFSLAAACVVIVVMLCFYVFDGRLDDGDKLIDTRKSEAVQESEVLSETTAEDAVMMASEDIAEEAVYDEAAEEENTNAKESRIFFMARGSDDESVTNDYAYTTEAAMEEAEEEMVEAAPKIAMMSPAPNDANIDSEYSKVANLTISAQDLEEVLADLPYTKKDGSVYEMDASSFETLSERVNLKGLSISYEEQNPESTLVLVIVSVK